MAMGRVQASASCEAQHEPVRQTPWASMLCKSHVHGCHCEAAQFALNAVGPRSGGPARSSASSTCAQSPQTQQSIVWLASSTPSTSRLWLARAHEWCRRALCFTQTMDCCV